MPTGTIYGSTGNQYIDSKIEWSYSQDTTGNTSTITAALYYKRNNTGYTTYGTGTFSITIGGKTTSITKSLTISNSTWVKAVEATETISHNSDGTKSVSMSTSGSISGTTLTSTSCSGTIKLTTIPRASTISSASNKTLGNACSVMWTPLSKSFRYKLKFTLGSFSHTTGAIHPNTISAYTYTGYTLSIADIAPQITGSPPTGTMTVTLYTFSDSNATTQVGLASSKSFTVTVPDNSSTKPSVSMSLAPVHSLGSAFSGLYIQGKSRVKATISGSGKYGASITSYGYTVLGKGYGSPFQSEVLNTSGTVTPEGRATDSRGFTSKITQNITVIPYSKPKLVRSSAEREIICARCDSSGNISETGTYLKIKVGRSYSKVMSGSSQKNFCLLRYRYKTASASNFSDYFTLLAKSDTSTDYVDVTIGNVVASVTTSYVVELSVIDDIGEFATVTFAVPTEDVTFNLRDGGDGAAFGKYAERAKALDIAADWDLYYKGDKAERKFYSLRGNTKIPSGSNINNYLTPDIYAVETDTAAESITNLPIGRAGLLRVYASTGQENVSEGTWRYLIQEYRCVIGTVPTYLRTIYSDATGEWHFDEWRIEKGSDSGWISLKQSGNATTPTTVTRGGAGCFYRVINENHVFVRFNCAFTFSGSSINVNSETIPAKYRPKNNAMALLPINDRGIARASVASDGYIYVNYVQNMATASTTTTFSVTWIDGYIDYWL